MSTTYRGVHWNRQKRLYDAAIAAIVLAGLGSFIGTSLALKPGITAETLIIRGTALTAILLLHIILCIGPMARLDNRFLPLLYNRRHFGVSMFLLAAVHAVFSVIQFHALGNLNPLLSVLTSYRREYGVPDGIEHFPFEPFGLLALMILFVMAATSHDFWLRNLGASFWKTMHCGVYIAYGALVVHVAYGILQSEPSAFYPVLLSIGFVVVAILHLAAARKELRTDQQGAFVPEDGFFQACNINDLEASKGHVAVIAGKRIAVYAQDRRVYALSNVCRHQGGPVGEGCVVDGLATCPWHGWQYRLDNGQSPPPFDTEFVPTHNVRVTNGVVYVDPKANPPLTVCEGAPLAEQPAANAAREFFIGYIPKMPDALARRTRHVALVALVAIVAVTGSVAGIQQPFDQGTFEFGVTRSFEGVLFETPVSSFVGREVDSGDAPHAYLLAAAGKMGLPPFAQGHHGAQVRFDGSLIYRNGLSMIEMNAPASFAITDTPQTPPEIEQGSAVRLIGELVDTKCFLGVMRPAHGKVHRACAIRCLEGGIPPGLWVRNDAEDTVYILAGTGDRPLEIDFQLAGRTVEVEGISEAHGSLAVIRVTSLRRAGE